MLKIVDIFKVGSLLSVTVEGNADGIKNGTRLVDKNGNEYTVISVGMAKYDDPHDISRYTTFLISPCSLEKGTELYTA